MTVINKSYPDTTTYPRSYRMSLGWRLFILLLAAALIVAGLVGSWVGLSAGGDRVLLLVCLLVFAMGTYMLLATLKYKVVLFRDAIEIHNLFSIKRLLCKQLRGRRVVRNGNGPEVIQLFPLDPKQKKIAIPKMLKTDAAFDLWMDNIADLDDQDRQQSMEEIAADRNLGITLEERTEKLEAGQRASKVWNILGGGITIWAIVYPQPFGLLMAALLAMPWVAILLMKMSNGLYQVDGRKNDVRPHLAALILMPGAGLVLRALSDFQLIHAKPAGLIAVVCSLILTGLFAYYDRFIRSKPLMLGLLALSMGAYGFGAASMLNARLDHSPAEIYQTQVLGKHASHGKSTSYYLQLAPWGPMTQSEDANVSHAMYDAIPVGGQACVVLRKGALRMPWYVVLPCGG